MLKFNTSVFGHFGLSNEANISSMNFAQFSAQEKDGLARKNDPVKVGIPFVAGYTKSLTSLKLWREDYNTELPCQLTALSFWPEGSLRWVLCQFLIDCEANQNIPLALGIPPSQSYSTNATHASITLTQTPQFITVDTGARAFNISQNSLDWHYLDAHSQSCEGKTTVKFNFFNDTTCQTQLHSCWKIVEPGPVVLTLTSTGEMLNANDNSLVSFECTLNFFAGRSTIETEINITNPRRALHRNGLWDLGDKNSVNFYSLSLEVTLGDTKTTKITTAPNTPCFLVAHPDTTKIFQYSSGGHNWNSANHIDANQEISVKQRGYSIYQNEQPLANGSRCQPVIHVETTKQHVQASIKHFWQKFPSAMETINNTLIIGLFPAQTNNNYELQGGERASQSCAVNYSNDEHELAAFNLPLTVTVSADTYAKANAFPWFVSEAKKPLLLNLIARGLDGKNNFFAKRELIDEFGWRNFGDIFADHETLYQPPNEQPYISHYNNQYDAIYGFARQFALSGDARWFELMDNLAHHVSDIDIYHTHQDRAEYNQGLFWHTDHYLDAGTATHRTYTRKKSPGVTAEQTGGGPAAEHCYTTGLMYHYLMTGNKASKDAMLGLTQWMIAVHEGQGGMLEQCYYIAKIDMPKCLALLKGGKVFSHRYPFTRGTGNYINSLLDAWQLTGEKKWIKLAEEVIQNTLHPADDISQRNLHNIENTWSYLVLLQSIAKYLLYKKELEQPDYNYNYGLQAFLHYAKWMAQYEQPFLNNSALLEFPNDTWAAQDLRKAMLMYQAAQFDPAQKKRYLDKAEQWFEYVIDSLLQSKENEFARILVLLMQNYGPQDLQPLDAFTQNSELKINFNPKDSMLSWKKLTHRIFCRLLTGLKHFDLKKDYHWIKARIIR